MQHLLLPLAVLVERLCGYPRPLMERVGHPVMWMGAGLAGLERRLNRPDWTGTRRRLAGVLALLVLLSATLAVSLVLVWLTSMLPFGWVLHAILATPLIAQNHLGRAVGDVATALGRSLAEGRKAVSHIVGRDPDRLDGPGVARAAIESLAENASDGVVAPLFWLALFGLPGIALYKAINTADSMIGHLDARYRHFGWASARLDDLVNLVPSRLTALLLAGAAALLAGASPSRAWRAALRDAPRHTSPNAGWPEAAMAGALGLGLGGPRAYGGEIVDLPSMGDGRRDLGPTDIERALTLYRRMLDLLLLLAVFIALARWPLG